jgi:ClpP class serine protease
VRRIALEKPIWAIAADSAFSAAYAIASSANRVVVTSTAGVGSIGVIAMHIDQSARDAQQGYRRQQTDASRRNGVTDQSGERWFALVQELVGHDHARGDVAQMTLAQVRGFLRAIALETALRDRALFQLALTATRGDAKAVDALDADLRARIERS